MEPECISYLRWAGTAWELLGDGFRVVLSKTSLSPWGNQLLKDFELATSKSIIFLDDPKEMVADF